MADDDRARFVRELMKAVRSLPPTGIPNWPAEVNEYCLRLRTRVIELSEVLDTRALNHYEYVTEYVKQLMKKLEDTMSKRRKSRAGGLAGNAMRIGGCLAYAHPVGKAAFWIGLAVSTGCDILAELKDNDIRALAMEINGILNRSRDSFRPVAGAIRRLDELLLKRIGSSIYDKELQDFLRNAEVNNNAVNAVPCWINNVEHRNNLMELVRNRELLSLLREIVRAIHNEDLLFFTLLSKALFAISWIPDSVNYSAAFQVGELCARGFALFLEYKHDKITLQHFGNEIGRMDYQLKAIKEVSPYL